MTPYGFLLAPCHLTPPTFLTFSRGTTWEPSQWLRALPSGLAFRETKHTEKNGTAKYCWLKELSYLIVLLDC